ncbi:MAG: hypothetical protein M5Z89_10400 [Olivibacter sp.]|nr:hypothetical protein [Olivibacter sp. UJ_SKK_5.1]
MFKTKIVQIIVLFVSLVAELSSYLLYTHVITEIVALYSLPINFNKFQIAGFLLLIHVIRHVERGPSVYHLKEKYYPKSTARKINLLNGDWGPLLLTANKAIALLLGWLFAYLVHYMFIHYFY